MAFKIGEQINNLTILDKKKEGRRVFYYCLCAICNNKKWIRSDRVKTSKSCGCLAKSTQFISKDITNKKFERLTALEKTDKRDKNNSSIIWKCKCSCGNVDYVYVSEGYLNAGKIKSCGCLVKDKSSQNIKKAIATHIEEHIIENTNIQTLKIERLSTNTSGVKGVTWDKARKKWRAQIEFQKKHYNLGRYENKEDAIAARKEAEEKMHKKFLRNLENK